MFESTGWELYEPELTDLAKLRSLQPLTIVRPPPTTTAMTTDDHQRTVEVLQQYQFSSTLQRMSVIARSASTGRFIAYTKGSPEMILSLSQPHSIPNDIMVTLGCFTEQGYRVIAVASKDIDATDEQVYIIIIIYGGNSDCEYRVTYSESVMWKSVG